MDHPVKTLHAQFKNISLYSLFTGQTSGFFMGPVVGLVWVLSLMFLPAPLAAQHLNEIVPKGVTMLWFSQSTSAASGGFSTSAEKVPLGVLFLGDDETLQTEYTGEADRKIKKNELLVNYGLSNTWTLSVQIPQVSVTQNSNLTGTTPAATEALAPFGASSRSGLGTLRIASLHRPVFSDQNGFVWGYGVNYPLSKPESPYAGNLTLDIARPTGSGFLFLQYTSYEFRYRGRYDLVVSGEMSRPGMVPLANGEQGRVEPGNRTFLSMRWGQEFGIIGYGLVGEILDVRPSTIDRIDLEDPAQAMNVRLQLALSNLTSLEKGPILPYLGRVEYFKTYRGRNVDQASGLSISLMTFF